MIACTFITDGGNRDDNAVLYLIIIQYAAGAKQNKLFGAHGNELFKTCDTGRRAYHGTVKSDRCIFIIDLVNGQCAACRIKLCYFLNII